MFFDPELLKSASLASSLVLQLTALTILGFFGGRWIDEQFLTQPTFQVLLTFAGFLVGIYNLIKRLKK